jgi:hypothetical protein
MTVVRLFRDPKHAAKAVVQLLAKGFASNEIGVLGRTQAAAPAGDTPAGEGLADEIFVCEWAVNLGRVEERDAAFDGCPEKRGHLLLVFGWTVGKTHSHAAQPDGRDFQITLSKFALLHI